MTNNRRMTARRVKVEGDLFHPRVPEGAEYVGREMPGYKRSPFCNPHRLVKPCKVKACGGVIHERDEALRLFQEHLDRHPELVEQARRELTGRDVACRCKPHEDCHADILLEYMARTEPV